jgi:hypothetical protein
VVEGLVGLEGTAMKALNDVVRKTAKKAGMSFVMHKIRAAAEGKLGERWHSLYWGLAGHKREISLVFGLIAVCTGYAGYTGGAEVFGTLAVIGLGAGVLDADWRAEKPVWLETTTWWHFLADNAATIASLNGIAATALASCNQGTADFLMKAHLTCEQGTWFLGLLGALAGFLGLKDAAMKARPPVPNPPLP